MRTRKIVLLASALISGTALATPSQPSSRTPKQSASADPVKEAFQTPPLAARPRVWWHWMNGNISKPGIAADLAWMKRVGIGGLQNFDVDLSTSQIVDKRLVYMTPEWKDAFRFAAEEADRHGLELAIASSPGWSETGGPWVSPEDGLKKLVWSETVISGGKRIKLKLAQPPSVAGPFQDLPMQIEVSDLIAMREPEHGPSLYRDVKVLAVPVRQEEALPAPLLTDGEGSALTSTSPKEIRNVKLTSIFAPKAPELRLDYGRPVTVRAVTLHIPGGAVPILGPLITPILQSSVDGTIWKDLTDIRLEETPTTLAIPATTARHFRVIVKPMQAGPGPDPAAEEAKRNLAMDDVFGRGIGALLGKPITIGMMQLHADTKLDRFELKAGFAIVDDYYALPTVEDGEGGSPSSATVDLTDRMQPDGSFDWTPPKGAWKIIRLGYSLRGKTNHPAPKEATGLEVDKYDGEAVERYLDHYLAKYRDAAGGLIGARGIRALLTDSIEIGAANWTPRFVEQFKALRGYDPTPWLPTVTGAIIDSRDASDKFLFDYRRTLSDLMASEHYGTVARVAHANGLKVYGESIEGNRSSFGDDMSMRRYADYPMAAMWTFDRAKGPQSSYVVDIKGAASVAHLYGQNIVAAESMTAAMAPWAFGPADLKHIVDLEFVLGVNRPVIHTSVHVPVEDRKPGLSLGGIGQFFNRNESWAELATPWVDYLSRNSFMMQQGRNVADIAYFYGEEAPLSGLYGRKEMPEVPQGFGYDFVNLEALNSAISNDGTGLLSTGGARYSVLFLGGSSSQMTLPALRRIAQLVEGGATLIGTAPVASPSLQTDTAEYARLVKRLWSGGEMQNVGKGRVIASGDLNAGLKLLGMRPDFGFRAENVDADLPFAHRKLSDGDTYFVVNRRNRPEVFEARFRVIGKAPELWHAETGKSEPVSYRIEGGETIIPMALPASGAVHVVFRKDAAQNAQTVRPVRVLDTVNVTQPWRVKFEAGRGAPASVDLPSLLPLNEHQDPNVRHFSGIATYMTNFRAPAQWKAGQALMLDLGEAREVAEVRINGQLAGYAWHAPYKLDVSQFARTGVNTLEVRVANLWVNRLIRDADPQVLDKASWASVPTYKPTAPLRRSGLIGPVKLEAVAR